MIMDIYLRCGVPLDHEYHSGDGGGGYGSGQRGDNGGIVHIDGVAGGIADAGHIAADYRRGNERLGGVVGSVGLHGGTATDTHCEAELVGIDLFFGKRGLVAERGQLPAALGGDGDGLHANRAVGIVDDLAVSSGRDVAGLAHRHRQRGRNSNAHRGSGRVAADTAIIGGAEIDRRGAGAAGCTDIIGKSGSGHGADHAEREDDSKNLFHEIFSFEFCRFWVTQVR